MVDVINEIDEFQLKPSFEGFIRVNKSLKSLQESIAFKEAMQGPKSGSIKNQLAEKIVEFFDKAKSESGNFFSNENLSISQVATISYGLKSVVGIDKTHHVFTEDHWSYLLPAIERVTFNMTQSVHKARLLECGQVSVGNELAFFTWLRTGAEYNIKVRVGPAQRNSVRAALLAHRAPPSDDRSYSRIEWRAIDRLLNAPVPSFDTRQLCKLVMQLGRMIKNGHLLFVNQANQPWIDKTDLTVKLGNFFNSDLMTEYRVSHHESSRGYVDPVAVDNLCEGLSELFKHKVLDWNNPNHLNVSFKTANFIGNAMSSVQLSGRLKQTFTSFLNQAIANVPNQSSQLFHETLKKINS